MLIQKLRLKRGWSQQQLAELSGLSARTIQRIERGQGASTESLKSLAAVFGIDFSNLQSESGMNTNLSLGVSPEEELALRQVRKLRSFYIHLIQYVVVICILAVVNIVLTPTKLWVVWVALGWGIGLLSHGLQTLDKFPFLGPEWERRQVERRLGRPL